MKQTAVKIIERSMLDSKGYHESGGFEQSRIGGFLDSRDELVEYLSMGIIQQAMLD